MEDTAPRHRWFTEARLGMFIHWGLFAQPKGYWNGRPYYGVVEYLPQVFRIPNAQWAKLAAEFDPAGFDAREWARVARQAGFKYVVITAKHHDGFAMFDSPSDPFNIVRATPFARDPIAELAEAVREEGLAFGFYYSQFLDWADPDASGNDWDFPVSGRRFDDYMNRKALPQLRELLSQYGRIDLLWFDIPATITPEQSRRFVEAARALQPDIVISSRIGNGYGDFETFGDNEIPPRAPDAKPWEAIFTHNHSWGYSGHDFTFKPARRLIRMIATVAARGGNTMINVGPEPGGKFPPETTAAFSEIGEWMARNGESIYGSVQAGLDPVPWGVITAKPGAIYLHLFERPSDGRLILPRGGELGPGEAVFLADGRPVRWTADGEDLWFELPEALPDPRNSVIKLSTAGAAAARPPVTILSPRHNGIMLDPTNAVLGPGVTHRRVSGWSYFGRTNYFASLAGLLSSDNHVRWNVRVLEPGDYWIELEYAADRDQADREAVVRFAGRDFPFRVLETGAVDLYRVTPITRQELGLVSVAEPGTYQLELRPAPTTAGGYLLTQRPTHLNTELFTFKRLSLSPYR